MARLSADEIIVECLKAEGVRYWFGSIGEEHHSLLDLMHLDGSIKLFDTRHENTGVVAALGYAHASGNAAVCSGTVGSGVANMFNGMYAAYRSYAPVVAIVCKNPPGYNERHVIKGFDQRAVFQNVTKWAIDVDDVQQLADALWRAFRVATAPPTGPVMVCINRKLLAQAGGPAIESALADRAHYKPASNLTYADEDVVDRAARMLVESALPAALIDERLFVNGSEAALVELVEYLAMPICSAGLSIWPAVPYDHPLCGGFIGDGVPPNHLAGTLRAEADLWLAVDCDFGLPMDGPAPAPPFRRIVQVDTDPAFIAKLYPVALGVLGHSKAVLGQLLRAVQKLGVDEAARRRRLERLRTDRAKWLAHVDEAVRGLETKVPISPSYLIRQVGDALPEDAFVVVRGGTVQQAVLTDGLLKTRAPRSVFTRGPECSLGQAVAKAMGIKLANPGRPVVALCGDGEFWFGNASELETLKRHKLPITIVISNNGSFGTNRITQTRRYGCRYVGVDIDNPDFTLLARAFDLHGERVTQPQEIGPALKRAMASGKAALVDVVTDPDESSGRIAESFQGVPTAAR